MDKVVVRYFPCKKLKNPFVIQAVESLVNNKKDIENTYSVNLMVYRNETGNEAADKIYKLVIIGTK